MIRQTKRVLHIFGEAFTLFLSVKCTHVATKQRNKHFEAATYPPNAISIALAKLQMLTKKRLLNFQADSFQISSLHSVISKDPVASTETASHVWDRVVHHLLHQIARHAGMKIKELRHGIFFHKHWLINCNQTRFALCSELYKRRNCTFFAHQRGMKFKIQPNLSSSRSDSGKCGRKRFTTGGLRGARNN